ncbi:hypothetical protein XMD579_000399 [Marinobacterium sp. xm-d-579]|uniref:hypothetical protein n=1 Tax=Marinobacterium sp. xm-d-579 TaxID=2497734 RepID=UPI0015680A40|nr:hypothetical protein [Marinobacterium sp. xm-d-579]NRP35594.1 hypothetical protein [Marinobacterium sp. xm-d-579]
MISSGLGNYKREQGIATLVTVVVLLIITTLAVFTVSSSVVNEKQVVANELRALAAFEAAQAGLAEGVAAFRESPQESASSSGAMPSGQGRWGYSVTSGDETVISSIGTSDDGSVQRQMRMNITFSRLDLPDAPVVAAAGANFSGNFEVKNLNGNLTVWSGGTVDLSGSFSTKVPHPTDDGVYITSSSSSYRGSDLIENDPNLSSLNEEDFQRAFLGSTVDEFCKSAYIDQNDDTIDFQAEIESSGSVICITNTKVVESFPDTVYEAVTIPTGTDLGGIPKTIIINGDWDQSNPNDFMGLVFVNGSVDKLNGSSTFKGSLLVNGDVDMGNGGPDLEFSIDYTSNLGDSVTASAVAGSWRDW